MQEEEYTIPQMVDDVRAGKMPRRRFIKTLTAMGISVTGIGAITAAAARSFASNATAHTVFKEAVEHDPLKLHDQHLANQTQGNTDDLQNDYASHAIVEDSMHSHAFIGRNAIMARKHVGLAAIPNLHLNV